jgi:hypothetical protein
MNTVIVSCIFFDTPYQCQFTPSTPPTRLPRLYYYIKPHCRVCSTPPPHDCGQSSVVLALRGRGIPNTISLSNTSDGALVRCLRGVVWPRGLTGPDVLGELQMEPSDGGGPIRSFFPAILLYQNAVFFMFCNEKASNSVDTAWQLPAALLALATAALQARIRTKVGLSVESTGSATIPSQLMIMAAASPGVKPDTRRLQGAIRKYPLEGLFSRFFSWCFLFVTQLGCFPPPPVIM